MVAATPNEAGNGLRILLVEDSYLVAHEIKWMLEKLGCTVIGPAPSVDEGLKLAQNEALDGAILDVNIVGGNCEPIARELRQRNCPFVLVTGYASPQIAGDLKETVSLLRKPITIDSLGQALDAEICRRDT